MVANVGFEGPWGGAVGLGLVGCPGWRLEVALTDPLPHFVTPKKIRGGGSNWLVATVCILVL